MNNRKSIFWITHTAIFLALLLAAQAVLRPLGQYVLGCAVNLVLITASVIAGLWSGAAVAALSPILAFFFGFGPAFPQILPAVILGNLTLVILWHLIAGRGEKKFYLRAVVAAIAAAALKFLVLWGGVVQVAVPLLSLPAQQAAVLSAAFSWPQLITAGIGGAAAILILPLLKRVLPGTKPK